jgi:hypothetical protein
MSRCAVCAHPRVADADSWLVIGKPHTAVAKLIGVSRYSVDRHVLNGHVVGSPSSGRQAPVVPANAGPVDLMRSIVDQLGSIDVSRLSPHAQTNHLDAYRRAVESLSKIAPPPAAETVRVEETEGYWDLMRVLWKNLEPHPAIRVAMAEDLERAGLPARREER